MRANEKRFTSRQLVKRTGIVAGLGWLALAAGTIAGCGDSAADTVSDNISNDAEQFKVGRRLTVNDSISGKTIYLIEGRCSFEVGDRRLDIICKDSPKKYTKATIGLGDNTSWASVQLGPINVSEYRTKIRLRPESLLPDFDLVTGEQTTNASGTTGAEGAP